MVQNITQHLVEVMKPLIRNELYFAKEQEQKEARQNQQPMTSQVVSAIAPSMDQPVSTGGQTQNLQYGQVTIAKRPSSSSQASLS